MLLNLELQIKTVSVFRFQVSSFQVCIFLSSFDNSYVNVSHSIEYVTIRVQISFSCNVTHDSYNVNLTFKILFVFSRNT